MAKKAKTTYKDSRPKSGKMHSNVIGKTPQLNNELPTQNANLRWLNSIFLTQRRTASKEKQRLERIAKEFEMGFKKLGNVGRAVTVFGSARFHLARSIGDILLLFNKLVVPN